VNRSIEIREKSDKEYITYYKLKVSPDHMGTRDEFHENKEEETSTMNNNEEKLLKKKPQSGSRKI
jgi:hypothetical protein